MNKQFAFGLGALVVIGVGALVFMKSSGDLPEEDGLPQNDPPKKLESLPLEKGLTPELTAALGAAAHVPDDVSVFTSRMNLASQCQRVWESNAVQNLVQLPSVQQLWMQAQRHPAFGSFMQTAHTFPLAVQGLPILRDAVSSEIFMCAGPDLPVTLNAIGELYTEMNLARLKGVIAGGGRAPVDFDIGTMIQTVLTKEKELRVPSVLIGFRLTNPAAATNFLDTWLPQIGQTPIGAIEKRAINDSQFYVLALSGQQAPPAVIQQLTLELQRGLVPPELGKRLIEFIRSQHLSVAVGILDGYLMISLGQDTSLLERWNARPSLAASDMLAPVRKHFQDGLLSLNYSAASMATRQPTAEDVENTVEYIAQTLEQANAIPGLAERLRKDAKLLSKEVVVEERTSTLSFSFENKGIESYTFGGPFPVSLDGSKPLSILTHRGQRPIVAAAARAAKNPEGYNQVARWLKIVYGYVDDFVLVELDPEDRAQFEKVMSVAVPFLTSFDAATRDHLIPAVDGTQSLLLLDGQGVLASMPGEDPLPMPFAVMRLGIVIELNDVEQFKAAMTLYADAFRKLFADIHGTFPSLASEFGGSDVTFPAVETRNTAVGTLYFHTIPVDLGPDLFPCALIKGNLLALATSSRLAEEMVGEQPMPSSPVIGLDKPAGAVLVVEFGELWNYLRRFSTAGFMLAQTSIRQGEDQTVNMIKMHVDAVLRSLSAVRSYHSTTSQQDGRRVNHSWLQIEDIGR
jgi:hypothetical protein